MFISQYRDPKQDFTKAGLIPLSKVPETSLEDLKCIFLITEALFLFIFIIKKNKEKNCLARV